jgi:tetratricopeptide (TPR) repeat protein
MPASTVDGDVCTRRAYTLKTSQKAWYLVYAAFCLSAGGYFLRETIAHPLGLALGLPFGLLFAVPGLILALAALRSRLILTGDELELRSALRTRTVRRDDIDGLQRIRNANGKFTRIFLKEHRGVLTVSGAFIGTADLEEWLKDLPDVDERNAAQIEQMIDRQSTARVGSQAHEALLRKARKWASGLTGTAALACIAGAVPYDPVYFAGMTALLAFPPLAIFLLHRWPLLFTTFKANVDPRADLIWLILLSGFGVLLSMMWASNPTHLVYDPTPSMLLWIGLAIFIAFFGSLAGTAWRSPARAVGLLMVTIFGIVYSVGLVDAADTMPDESSPSFFRTWIVEKHEHQGRRSTTYYLRVAPWGTIRYADEVSVPVGRYHRSVVGDPVCLALHRGFLHAPWYRELPCSGVVGRDATLSVPQTVRDASALLTDAERDAAQRPRDAHAQFVLGVCLVQLKRYDEALPPLLAAERLDSSNAPNHGVIGWVLNQQGRFAEAVPHLRAAVALDSTYGLAEHHLAWAYFQLHDLPSAERAYSVVVRLEPKSGEAAYEYAWILTQQHGARAAEDQLARALLLEPKNGDIQAFAGFLFRQEARYADARQHYEAASRLLPNDAAVWAELAATDYLLNDRAAAAAAFAKSVGLDASYVRSRPDLAKMWRDVAPENAG